MTATLTNKEMKPYLQTLQKSIPEFNEYWYSHENEIKQFEDRITWKIDSARSPSSRRTPMGYEIFLKTFPKTFDDAHIVSHEMEHGRLWENGYPNFKPRFTDKKTDYISWGRQCSAVTNLIYNPIIELHLNDFFNSCQKNKGIYEGKLAEWNKIPLTNARDLFCYSCYYLTGIITIKWLCGNIHDIKNLNEFRNDRQEDIIKCSNKICLFLKKNHFMRSEVKSKEYITVLLNGFKTEFKLNCIIV